MHPRIGLYKVTRRVVSYIMVVGYSEDHAEKIARKLGNEEFSDVERCYEAVEIVKEGDIPEDWRDLGPWPEPGKNYLEEEFTCKEMLAHASMQRGGANVLAQYGHRCVYCDADLTTVPSRVHLAESSSGLRTHQPFCIRCSEALHPDDGADQI